MISPLRVGVMVDSPRVPAWIAWIVTAIRERPSMTLALVVLGGEAERPRTLFSLYEALDRRAFPVEPDALEEVDSSAALAGVPRVAAADVAAVGRHDLDVLLWLGSGTPAGAILSAPRHGVWRYRVGSGEPPLFWELFAGAPAAQSRLEIAGGEVIYRSTAPNDPVSLNRSRGPVYWKSARFAVRRLEDLASGRWRPGDLQEQGRSVHAAPTRVQTLRHVARVTARATRRKLREIVLEHQWFLGVRRRTGDRLPHEDPSRWLVVLPAPDRSYADPFVVRHGDETLVFLEELVHATGRGRLAVGRLEPDGELSAVEPILPCAHHISYPYVFRHGGRFFLIPETGDARRVTLFAATRFPHEWEPVATLLEGVNAVDASVHAGDGLFWMWVSIAVPGGRLIDETHLYLSDRLEAGWTPHPRNPVVSDARTARPAGRTFLHRGRLIRPSQNCAERYGGRVVFNEVEVLTPEEYRERPCGSLGPDWAGPWNLAAHSYAFDGDWEATDGLRTFRRAAPRTATTPG